MSSIPATQKAWKVVRRGSPAQALVCDEKADVPSKLAPGEILVKVQAAALNPVFVQRSSISDVYEVHTDALQWT